MKQCICIILLISFTLSLQAQKFLRPFESISHKKTSYITKENGKEIKGTVKKIKRKKGLIKSIEIKIDGKKTEIPIEEIKFAYLPQSGWDKFLKFDDFVSDANQWDDGLHDKDRIKEGYAYFEKAEVIVNKKKRILLMQLLNPGICKRIKVYHDPFANETTGFGVAGVQLAGGQDKSYYISIDGEVSKRIKKKEYNKKKVSTLFGSCSNMSEKNKKSHWENFPKAVYQYNTECSK